MASSGRSKAAPTAGRLGSRPRAAQSARNRSGEACPRRLLQPRHAHSSFSGQAGPPFRRGTRCSVEASRSAGSSGRRHHTHSWPSRSMAWSRRSARGSSRTSSTVARSRGGGRRSTGPGRCYGRPVGDEPDLARVIATLHGLLARSGALRAVVLVDRGEDDVPLVVDYDANGDAEVAEGGDARPWPPDAWVAAEPYDLPPLGMLPPLEVVGLGRDPRVGRPRAGVAALG